jgi:hypothetical protein
VEHEADPHKSDSILFVEGVKFPVSVANWIFYEASNVLEGSPFLGFISWLLCVKNKLGEITIGFFSESSIIQ